MEQADQQNTTAKDPQGKPLEDKAQGLGLSKAIYGLGTSARDAFLWVVGVTVVLTPVIYYGQKLQIKPIEWLAKFPHKVKETSEKFLTEHSSGLMEKIHDKAGKLANAFGISLGIGVIVSHFTQLPGLVLGSRKVDKANDIYAQQVQLNKELTTTTQALKKDKEVLEKDKKLLNEDMAKLNEELAKLKESRPSMVERAQSTSQEAGIGGI